MGNEILNIPTKRVKNHSIHDIVIEAQETPNCGLKCYLTEAFIKAEITHNNEDDYTDAVITSLLDEKQEYSRFNNRYFWGWEKNPIIEGSNFPFDWDDTAKAIDLLRIAKEHNKAGKVDFNLLPGDDDLNIIFKESIFKRNTIGEVKPISCPFDTALFVFFGDLPSNMQKRDDPMVTIATIRMLAKWHPYVIKSNKYVVKELMKRAIFTLNYLLENKTEHFKNFSRYYFSLGHFTYRLYETIDLLNKIGIKTSFNLLMLHKSKLYRQNLNFEKVKYQVRISYATINSKTQIDNDCFWWYLLGLKIELITSQNDFREKIKQFCTDRIIYQHRRLNHQYYSEDWEKKLLIFELQQHNININKNNIDNINGLRFLKKSTIPIFAIASLIIFILSYSINNEKIITKIITETNVFKSLIEKPNNNEESADLIMHATRTKFPQIDLILNLIFIIIGLRLYLQAWAVEETYLTNRIQAPIKSSFRRGTIIIFDNFVRFIWTVSIMFFPVYFSLKNVEIKISWDRYLFYIFLLIAIWDLIIYIDYKKLYQKLGKSIKDVNVFWILFDFILFILVGLHTLLLSSSQKLEGWQPVVFMFIWGSFMLLSCIQIFVFSRTIFSNKISYKYDS